MKSAAQGPCLVGLCVSLLVVLLCLHGHGQEAASPPRSGPEQAQKIVAGMQQQPQWMVGQVCMVGVWGNNFDPSAAVREKWQQSARLIQEYHVGSVILFESNFSNVAKPWLPSTPAQVASLCQELQQLAAQAAEREGRPPVPLFISVDHEGDGVPWTRIRGGVTPIPSNMAIGATWDLDFAGRVGKVVGSELALLGVNMLLGPVLDVNSDPTKDAMGERTFGGDPCWVGRMGRAYIRGVHEGAASQGRGISVVAKHWPGHGDCDRLSDYEVARLGGTLEELGGKELMPFLMVVGADDRRARPEALMPAHSVYPELQSGQDPYPLTLDTSGDLVATFTSGDQGAGASPTLRQRLHALEEWHQDGLMVSDALGVEGLMGEYARRGHRAFPYSDAARRALLAGHDVVMLTGYRKWEAQMAVLDDLTSLYERGLRPQAPEAEARFVQRVREAARRVVAAKLRLLGRPEQASGPRRSPSEIAEQCQELCAQNTRLLYARDRAAWQQAVQWVKGTQGSPPPADASIVTIEPLAVSPMAMDPPRMGLIADIIRHKYPRAGSATLVRLTTQQVRAFLRSDPPKLAAHTKGALDKAPWVVILLTHRPRTPQAMEEKGGIDSVEWSLELLRRLPRLYTGTARKRVAVISCQVPYYLGASDVAEVDAYLLTHTKLPRYLEAAVDALFGARQAAALAAPVSVPGVGYELAAVLEPDPSQEFSLSVEPDTQSDSVWLVTGTVKDAVGRPVPDDTEVRFLADLGGEQAGAAPVLTGLTVDGVARCELTRDTVRSLRAATAVTANGASSRRVLLEARRRLGPAGWGLLILLMLLLAAGVVLFARRRALRAVDYARAPEVLYTFLFVDVRGSTPLKAGAEPLLVRRTFDAYHHWVRQTVEAREGTVYSTSGDGVLCRFVRAADGVAAARDLIQSLDSFNEQHNLLGRPLLVGIGVHTGPVLESARDDHGRVSSHTIDLAAKLQQQAKPREVLVSAETVARLGTREGLVEAGTAIGEVAVFRLE